MNLPSQLKFNLFLVAFKSCNPFRRSYCINLFINNLLALRYALRVVRPGRVILIYRFSRIADIASTQHRVTRVNPRHNAEIAASRL